MTKDQDKRLKQLTDYLVNHYISEDEYHEYQQLSKVLLDELNDHPKKSVNKYE